MVKKVKSQDHHPVIQVKKVKSQDHHPVIQVKKVKSQDHHPHPHPRESKISSNSKRNSILQVSLLLQIDPKGRIEIWKRVPYPSLLILRLTCSRIKSEIDHHVGLRLTIDETKPSFDFATNVGIERLRIKKLGTDKSATSKFTQFLLHPILLKKVEIVGDLSVKYGSYIFESPHNIRSLTIHFNHHLLHHHASLFPVAQPFHGVAVGAFPAVTSLHIDSPTVTPAEFTHLRDLLYDLFCQDLRSAKLREIKVIVRPAAGIQRILKTFHSSLAHFVNSNALTLVTLHIDINQRLTKVGQNELREVLESHSSTSQLTLLSTSSSAPEPHLRFEPDVNDPSGTAMVKYWNPCPVLKVVFLSVNKFAFFWTTCLIATKSLKSLYLNLKISENWKSYILTVAKSARTLQGVELHTVNRGNVGKGAYARETNIDLSVFARCSKLTQLTLICKEDELLGTVYELQNISSVFGIERLVFGWVGVSPCQLTRLLMCSRTLKQLDLEYCSINESTFADYFRRIRWLIGLKVTKISGLSVTDHKIRFQSKMKTVTNFTNAQWRHTAYYDGYYIKVVYSKFIKNMTKRAQQRVAFPSAPNIQDAGRSQATLPEIGDD